MLNFQEEPPVRPDKPTESMSMNQVCRPAKIANPALREKLAKYGTKALTNTELLAVALGTGPGGENIVKVAEDLMHQHGAEGVPGLTLEDWSATKGVGAGMASRMVAAFEFARRVLVRPESEFRVSSPQEAYELVRDLKRARKEHLVALYLDAQNHLIRRETISIGSLNTTRTHPREILQPAILHSALAFVLVHNHPSGSLEPSRDDLDFTRSIARAGELIGVGLADHLIVSPKGYVSLKERGAI